MITEVWGVDNEMVDQIRSNTVACHLWAPQDSALMPEVCDKHWGSEFLVTFNSKGKIYGIGNRF